MGRSIFLAAFVYGLLLAGTISLNSGFIALAIPFMLYLAYGIWFAPQVLDVRVERSMSHDRTVPGAQVLITLNITNHGEHPAEFFVEDLISPRLTVHRGSPRHMMRLSKRESRSFSYHVSGPRGTYSFNSVLAAASDPLGLIRRERVLSTEGQLLVFPQFERLKHVSIRPRRTRLYAGSIPARVSGTGVEFFGVREYQAGDSPRSINWRVSARHDEALYSNEYQQERVADVGIVLDARESVNIFRSRQSIFEHNVTAAAALSDVFLAQGNRVGMFVYSGFLGWTLPGYGKLQRENILRTLSRAQVGASSVFTGLEQLSPRMFPPESQIVLVSCLQPDDLNVLVQLRGKGYQVMVVSPDPVKFELSLLPQSKNISVSARIIRMERDLLLLRLERAGVQVIEWDVSLPFDQAVGPLLARRRMSL